MIINRYTYNHYDRFLSIVASHECLSYITVKQDIPWQQTMGEGTFPWSNSLVDTIVRREIIWEIWKTYYYSAIWQLASD